MGTNYIAPIWRMPENANKDKLSNYSIDFNSSDPNYIDCGNSTDLQFSGSFSISCWAKINNTGSNAIISKDSDISFGEGYHIDFRGGNAVHAWAYDANDKLIATGLSTDTWYHIVFVFESTGGSNGNQSLYINAGTPVTNSITNFAASTIKNLRIGSSEVLSGFSTDGEISQVSIFDYALTDGTGGTTDQIGYLYNLNNPMVPGDVNLTAPVGYWPLGDNSNPNTDAGYPNISTGADSVFLFSGSQNIDVPDSDSLSFGDSVDDSPFTMSAWIKSSNSSGRGIMSKFASTGHEWLLWTVGSGAAKVRMNLYDGGATVYQTTQGNSTVDTGEWVHVVATYDGGGGSTAGQGIKIYVNGEEDTPYSYLNNGAYQSMHNTTTEVQIADYGNNSGGWNGEMSNCQIWGRVLTDPEVKTLYNNGQPLMTGTQPQEADLKAWWKLNQTANWQADTINGVVQDWQIPDATSAYPKSFKFSDNLESVYSANDLGMDKTKVRCVSFWYKNEQQSQYGYVINCRSTTQGAGFAFICRNNSGVDSGYVFSTRYTGGSTGYIQTGYLGTLKIPRDGNWHHVAFTHSETDQLKVYIDGVYKYQKVSTGPSDGSDPIRLRIGGPGSTQDISGMLSNMMIWEDVVLTDGGVALNDVAGGEIAQLYNNGKPLISTIQSDKLLAWYKFDDTEKFDGANWSIENQKYPANWNTAVKFDKSLTQYIRIPDTPTLSFGDGTNDSPFSISAWINFTDVTSTGIFSKSQTSSNREYSFHIASNDKIYFNLFSLGTTSDYISRRVETLMTQYEKQWTHVVATYDGSRDVNGIKIYINKVRSDDAGTVAGSYTAMTNTIADPFIGRGLSNYAEGNMSNVAVFDKELTQENINAIYNNGTPEINISESPISWWKLDNVITGIQDSIGSNNGINTNDAVQSNTFVSIEALYSEDLPEQALVNNNVSVLNGDSVGMLTTALVQSNLTRTQPFSSYSYNLDGGTEYWTAGTTLGDSLGNAYTGPISVSIWINTGSLGQEQGIFSLCKDNATLDELSISLDYDFGYYWTLNANGNAAYAQTTSVPITANTWHHLLCTFEPSAMKLYVDGQEISLSGTTTYTNLDLTGMETLIGGYYQIGSFEFLGYLSNCAVWNQILTQDDALNLYNNGVPQDLNNFRLTPIRWWSLDQNYSYWDGTNIIARDKISGDDATGINIAQIDLEGNAPGSDANGEGSNLAIADLKGNMSDSDKNAFSINMADYADGVTNPANSGRSTDTP